MIIYEKNDFLDFEAPIHMSEEQREKFIQFMRKTFDKVTLVDVEEVQKEVGERETNPKKWTANDIFYLFSAKDEDELSDILQRSRMSIRMARGHMIGSIMAWAKKEKIKPPFNKRIIQQFLEDQKK